MTKTLTSRTSSILGTYFQATASDHANGRQWYTAAHNEALQLSGLHPYDVIQTAGVIAALSPNNNWARNLTDATAMINAHHFRGPDAASQLRVCTYGINKQKALAILSMQGATVDTVAAVLNGRKVSSFFRCILGDPQAVCVDGHAFSIWAGEPIPTTKVPSISARLYAQIAQDYREAAYIASQQDRTPITPAQLQAVTWITHRRLKSL